VRRWLVTEARDGRAVRATRERCPVKHARPRRRRGRFLVGTVVVVLALAACGAVWVGVRSLMSVDDLEADATPAELPATTATTAPREVVERVVVLGDSLVVGAEPAMRRLFDEHDVELTVVGGVGEGFLSPDADWLEELEDAVERTDPQVVVIEACCNIPSPKVLVDGKAVDADGRDAYAAWATAAREAVSIATASGARVMWVLTPQVAIPSANDDLAGRITALNRIYAGLGVELVDWDAALRDEDRRQVKAGDGLHLTGAGSEVVAEVTVDAVLTRT
jgi:hypothetical protein